MSWKRDWMQMALKHLASQNNSDFHSLLMVFEAAEDQQIKTIPS
jgi:hypothetical protein